jgi:hypothetical protein
MLYAPLISPMRATCPAHLILLALITLTILGEEYKPCSSSVCSFLQPPVTSSLLGSNILLSTLFSNTLNLCSSLNVKDQVSHPYKTTLHHYKDQFVNVVKEIIAVYSENHKKPTNTNRGVNDY